MAAVDKAWSLLASPQNSHTALHLNTFTLFEVCCFRISFRFRSKCISFSWSII